MAGPENGEGTAPAPLTGASFTAVMLMVVVALPERLPPPVLPLSLTVMVNVVVALGVLVLSM